MINTFYNLMRFSYDKVYGYQHMLHYPLYREDGQTLMQGQIHLVDYCLSHIPELRSRRLLDAGCGNGVQTLYVHETFGTNYALGVDINEMHIGLANKEKSRKNLKNIHFVVEDCQKLTSIEDNSFDAVICIESAHHYLAKEEFLFQIRRVLRPGGNFVIADLLQRENMAPGRLDKYFMLFYWPREKYIRTLQRLGLDVVKEEDLTSLITPAFRMSDQWFTNPSGENRLLFHLGKLIGRGLIKLYIYQLKHSVQYHLIVGRKPQG